MESYQRINFPKGLPAVYFLWSTKRCASSWLFFVNSRLLFRPEVYQDLGNLVFSLNIFFRRIFLTSSILENVKIAHVSLSPILFNIYAEEAFRSCKIKNGIEIYGEKKLYKISYADDTVIMAESEKELNDTLNKIKSNLQKWSIEINPKKTKCMVVTDNVTQKIDIQIGDDKLEQVSNFQYLGLWINETMKHDVDVRANIAKSKQAFWRHKELLRNNIRLKTKLRLLKTQIWSILRYDRNALH